MAQPRYTTDHEYVRLEEDLGVIGVSEHAQAQLGDIVYVELPPVGARLAKGAQAAVVESVKAASEVFSPASGEVVSVNSRLESEPSLINDDAIGEGWIMKLKLSDPSELDALMDDAAYREFLKTAS
jgi:glycine cleavage system H protein